MKTLRVILITIFSFITTSSFASMCTAHSSNYENKSSNKMSYRSPCEISDTVLMASSEEVFMSLIEKIANHDHD